MDREEEREKEQEEVEEADKNFALTTPYNTFVLLGCIVFVFLAQQLLPIKAVVLLVGFEKTFFLEGEYWRILTASVVHGGIYHIGFNGFALFMLGRLAELLSSKANVPIVFVLSAVFGSVLSLLFAPDIASIGASGGVIGILGYLTLYSYRRRKLISTRLFRDLLINIAFIAVFGLVIVPYFSSDGPGIDNWAHLGGLLAGLVYGVFEVPDDLYVDPRKTSKAKSITSYVSLGLVILTSLFAIGIIVSFFLSVQG